MRELCYLEAGSMVSSPSLPWGPTMWVQSGWKWTRYTHMSSALARHVQERTVLFLCVCACQEKYICLSACDASKKSKKHRGVGTCVVM